MNAKSETGHCLCGAGRSRNSADGVSHADTAMAQTAPIANLKFIPTLPMVC
jgi:hypothetical protein